MRKRNWRIMIVFFVLAALAAGFYLITSPIVMSSSGPTALMQMMGCFYGVATGLGLVMFTAGLIGKKIWLINLQ